jgi:cell division inhibitor SepF
MGIFNKFKDLVGIEEVDEDISEEEIESVAAKLDKRQEGPNSFTTPRPEIIDSRNVAIQKPLSPNTSSLKLIVIEPKSFDECSKLVDNLKSRKPVIINLEKIDTDVARKIFDFLSGATYALNGNVQKIANNIFVFAPENVGISSTIDHKGIEFETGVKSPWR